MANFTRWRKAIADNLWLFVIGLVYYWAFTGITVGDLFFRNLENNYPLFLTTAWGHWPVWMGFDFAHLLNIPTLRVVQLLLALVRIKPNPLFITQLVNLALSLAALKLLHVFLLELKLSRFAAKTTTVLFAFSFGFFANMNAEIHHFSVLLIVLALVLLQRIKNNTADGQRPVMLFALSLALVPLFHFENIIYVGLLALYILFNKDLRPKFLARSGPVIIALIIIPALLVAASFLFYYVESGAGSLRQLWQESPMFARLHYETHASVAGMMNFSPRHAYGMSRAYLESFAVISKMLTLVSNYSRAAVYANLFLLRFSIAFTALFALVFALVHALVLRHVIKKWRSLDGIIKYVLSGWLVYLIIFGFFVSSVFHISEFFIVAALFFCILAGAALDKTRDWGRAVLLIFTVLVVFSNLFWYTYPQKVSAGSVDKLFEIVALDKNAPSSVMRIAFFDMPYEAGLHKNIKIYSDEHAYKSDVSVRRQLSVIRQRLRVGDRVYLLLPDFLLKGNPAPLELLMGQNPAVVKRCALLARTALKRYKTTFIKSCPYNWAYLGQLGRVALVELK